MYFRQSCVCCNKLLLFSEERDKFPLSEIVHIKNQLYWLSAQSCHFPHTSFSTTTHSLRHIQLFVDLNIDHHQTAHTNKDINLKVAYLINGFFFHTEESLTAGKNTMLKIINKRSSQTHAVQNCDTSRWNPKLAVPSTHDALQMPSQLVRVSRVLACRFLPAATNTGLTRHTGKLLLGLSAMETRPNCTNC